MRCCSFTLWLVLPTLAGLLFCLSCNKRPAVERSARLVAVADTDEPEDDSGEPKPAEDDAAGEDGEADSHKSAKKHGPNRLAKETSPYLLLHAHNPVDWYPWGEEALAKAKNENKLIFLSVGYSSCYWCHVMERESFMDDEIAEYLNEHFVCIKVDREERPDVDQIYMTALHVLGERGGWPLSMFVTPDGKPFVGGTYFPPRDGVREGRPGFLTVVKHVQKTWKEEEENVRKYTDRLAEHVNQRLAGQRRSALDQLETKMIDGALAALADDFDPHFGGFDYDPRNHQIPKFPNTSNLLLLLNRVKHGDEATVEESRRMLVRTLEKMSRGGIYDHLGGGFHRYSVDRYWRIPHFEKMLYDNGQLATVYAEAHQLTGREDFRQVTVGILEFVLREMTDDSGGFYSALDAETDAEEGKFYRWEKEEVQKLLDEDEFELFAAVYGLNDEPNFEEHYYAPQPETRLAAEAEQREVTTDELWAQLTSAREKLFKARAARERPLTDTKVLTAWNGLMIRGFADAGRLLEEPKYIEAAARAADYLLNTHRTEDGRLLRTSSAGEAKLNAYLNDYAFLVDGLLALHKATGEDRWLQIADELTQKQIELFWDEDEGGFFFTSSDHEELIARAKNPVDVAIPSGNSVSADNLVTLAAQLDNADYARKAERTLLASTRLLRLAPSAVPRMALALDRYLRAFPPELDDNPRNDPPRPPMPVE